MSVLNLSTSATDKLFLEYIKPTLEDLFIANTIVYDRFKTKEETCLGKYGVAKVATAGATSFGPSSTSDYPTARQGSYNEFHFYMKRNYGSLQFDGLALAVGKGKGAIKDILATETENFMTTTADRLNKQFWGDGSGRLAQLSAAISNTTTGYVDGHLFGQDANDYTDPSKYLTINLLVDIYSTAGVLEAEAVEITAITLGGAGTDTLTFGSNVTASNNSYILLSNTYASSEAAGTGTPMGLKGIISTANATVGITATSAFQGVNRSSYTWACAQTWGNSSQPINNKAMLKAVQMCERYGNTSVIITNDVIWRAYYEILEADKTLPNETEFWGGTSGLVFYGGKKRKIPVIYDYDCPDNLMYFIDDTKIIISAPVKNGMDWIPGGDGHILERVQGKDEFVANLVWYYNMTCTNPRALGYITAIKHASS